MSFDLENFIGLYNAGDSGAPTGSTDGGYAYLVGGRTFGGGEDPDDYITCDAIDIGPGAGVSSHQYPGLAALIPADITSVAPGLFLGVESTALGDLSRPPDFVTCRLLMGFGTEGDVDSLIGYYDGACVPIVYDGDGHPVSGGGIDEASFHDPEYTMSADLIESGPGHTFVPLDASVDGANGHGLDGYFRRATSAYTGNPSNTASDYLWPYGEIDTNNFMKFTMDFNGTTGFHKAAINGVTFIIRPFWARPRGFVCLV